MDTDEMNLPTGLDEAVNEEHQLVISYYSCVGDGTNQHTHSLFRYRWYALMAHLPPHCLTP